MGILSELVQGGCYEEKVLPQLICSLALHQHSGKKEAKKG